MQFIEADPLPKVCQECGERRELLARGEGEWCCDECDHLAERFIMIPDREIKLKPRKKPIQYAAGSMPLH